VCPLYARFARDRKLIIGWIEAENSIEPITDEN
jgi:hypothetical protein